MTTIAPTLEDAHSIAKPAAPARRREAILDALTVTLACLIFLGVSLFQLDLPGLYTDEAYDVIPAMQMVLGHRVELQGEVLDLGSLRLPLMSSSAYQGVTYTYLALPFFALGGVNIFSLRLMTVLVGMLGVILAYFLGRSWFGRDVGRVAALLLALSPAWVFWSRLGVYVVSIVVPIAIGALLAFTSWVRAYPRKGHGKFYLGMFLLGLGMTTKLLFLWFIAAVVIAALILWGRALWRHLGMIRQNSWARGRTLLFGLFWFCIGALPFILYNVLTRGTVNLLRQTLSGSSTTTHGVDNIAFVRNLWTEVDAFKVLLDGGYFWFQGRGASQEPYANPVTPAIFAIAAIGLLALILARKTQESLLQTPYSLYRLHTILLTAALTLSFLLGVISPTGTAGALLTAITILLGLAGMALLVRILSRDTSATAPVAWLLLAFTTASGALWWFGGGGRPEGKAPGAFLGLWPIDTAGILFWTAGAVLLIVLGTDKQPVPYQRASVATLSLIGLVVAQSTVTVSGLWSTHILILLPLPQIVIGAFAVLGTRSLAGWLSAIRRGKSWRRLAALPATLLVGAVLVGDAVVAGLYHRDLTLTGGTSTFSDAIYSLNRYLQTDKAGYKVVAMDWGFRRPLQFLSEERIDPIEGYGLSEEPPPEFYTSLREFLQDEKTVYLFHTEMGTAYPRRAAFMQEVVATGKEAILDKTFTHRDGFPVYEIYMVK